MNIIFLGAPGAGKGTQSAVIAEKLNIPTISTGAIIRNALKNGTEMGLAAKSYMDKGELVPDDVVLGIIKERIAESDCKNGYILDGFPRTIPQAEALDKMNINIDYVIEIDVPDSEILQRLSGRRVCENCTAVYHITANPPKQDGVCDECANALSTRRDDHEDTIKARLEVYHSETEPLVDFYRNKGQFYKIDGLKHIDVITEDIMKIMDIK